MRGQNVPTVGAFVLAGFPAAARLRPVLFLLFPLARLLVPADSLAVLLTARRSAAPHRPVCCFLGALSSLEIWYESDVLPKMLGGLLLQRRRISFAGCVTQLYFFSSLVCTECALPASMAYDRHVATCHPLRHHVIVTTGRCVRLVAFSFACGFSISVVKVCFISSATFRGSNVPNHFFCDISPILKLACTDFSTAELGDFVLAFIILVLPLVATVLSYRHITLAVLRIPSATGRGRAFSTCASHLTMVTIFYTAVIFMYVRPQAIDSRSSNKLISAVYTVLTPIINPLIYCLRSKEFKAALKKLLG